MLKTNLLFCLLRPCVFNVHHRFKINSNSAKRLHLIDSKFFTTSLLRLNKADDVNDEIDESVFLEREFEELTIEKYQELITDDNVRQEIENILNDYELVKYETGRVPTTITIKNMKEMLSLTSHQAKIGYINYMLKTELRKAAAVRKKIASKTDKAKSIAHMVENKIPFKMGIDYDPVTGTPVYGKWRVNYFLNITRSQIMSIYDRKIIQASLFGQKLVLDFDFEDCMDKREIKNTALQATIAFSNNRKALYPFDFWFCNLNPTSLQAEIIDRAFGIDRGSNSSQLINFTPDSFTSLFPFSQIIYLSPNAKETLTSFDDDAIYVIGALVDLKIIKPITFTKCKREKIRCCKLPLDDYFSFKTKKTLTIDQMVTILLELKAHGDMFQALKKGIPPRKIKTDEELAEEQRQRIERLSKKRKQMFKLKCD